MSQNQPNKINPFAQAKAGFKTGISKFFGNAAAAPAKLPERPKQISKLFRSKEGLLAISDGETAFVVEPDTGNLREILTVYSKTVRATEDVPDVVFFLDNSYSMDGRCYDAARNPIGTRLQNCCKMLQSLGQVARDQNIVISVRTFNSTVGREITRSDSPDFNTRISAIGPAGGTDLCAVAIEGSKELQRGVPVVFVMTDGESNVYDHQLVQAGSGFPEGANFFWVGYKDARVSDLTDKFAKIMNSVTPHNEQVSVLSSQVETEMVNLIASKFTGNAQMSGSNLTINNSEVRVTWMTDGSPGTILGTVLDVPLSEENNQIKLSVAQKEGEPLEFVFDQMDPQPDTDFQALFTNLLDVMGSVQTIQSIDYSKPKQVGNNTLYSNPHGSDVSLKEVVERIDQLSRTMRRYQTPGDDFFLMPTEEAKQIARNKKGDNVQLLVSRFKFQDPQLFALAMYLFTELKDRVNVMRNAYVSVVGENGVVEISRNADPMKRALEIGANMNQSKKPAKLIEWINDLCRRTGLKFQEIRQMKITFAVPTACGTRLVLEDGSIIDRPEVNVVTDCPICLMPMEPNVVVAICQQCKNCFDADCFTTWRTQGAGNCPVCRHNEIKDAIPEHKPGYLEESCMVMCKIFDINAEAIYHSPSEITIKNVGSGKLQRTVDVMTSHNSCLTNHVPIPICTSVPDMANAVLNTTQLLLARNSCGIMAIWKTIASVIYQHACMKDKYDPQTQALFATTLWTYHLATRDMPDGTKGPMFNPSFKMLEMLVNQPDYLFTGNLQARKTVGTERGRAACLPLVFSGFYLHSHFNEMDEKFRFHNVMNRSIATWFGKQIDYFTSNKNVPEDIKRLAATISGELLDLTEDWGTLDYNTRETVVVDAVDEIVDILQRFYDQVLRSNKDFPNDIGLCVSRLMSIFQHISTHASSPGFESIHYDCAHGQIPTFSDVSVPAGFPVVLKDGSLDVLTPEHGTNYVEFVIGLVDAIRSNKTQLGSLSVVQAAKKEEQDRINKEKQIRQQLLNSIKVIAQEIKDMQVSTNELFPDPVTVAKRTVEFPIIGPGQHGKTQLLAALALSCLPQTTVNKVIRICKRIEQVALSQGIPFQFQQAIRVILDGASDGEIDELLTWSEPDDEGNVIQGCTRRSKTRPVTLAPDVYITATDTPGQSNESFNNARIKALLGAKYTAFVLSTVDNEFEDAMKISGTVRQQFALAFELGITHYLVFASKMDIGDDKWSQEKFNTFCTNFFDNDTVKMMGEAGATFDIIPIAAIDLDNGNVGHPSKLMPWFTRSAKDALIESVRKQNDTPSDHGLMMIDNWVNDIGGLIDKSVFTGKVISGRIPGAGDNDEYEPNTHQVLIMLNNGTLEKTTSDTVETWRKRLWDGAGPGMHIGVRVEGRSFSRFARGGILLYKPKYSGKEFVLIQPGTTVDAHVNIVWEAMTFYQKNTGAAAFALLNGLTPPDVRRTLRTYKREIKDATAEDAALLQTKINDIEGAVHYKIYSVDGSVNIGNQSAKVSVELVEKTPIEFDTIKMDPRKPNEYSLKKGMTGIVKIKFNEPVWVSQEFPQFSTMLFKSGIKRRLHFSATLM